MDEHEHFNVGVWNSCIFVAFLFNLILNIFLLLLLTLTLQELEVVQEDLGSGYTTVRKIDSGDYGFLPTTSLIFD